MGLNVQTPETESSTHYFWSGAHTCEPVEARQARVREAMRQNLTQTFGEDKVVVEAQQESLDRQEAPLVMISSDAGLAHARRIVTALVERESQAQSNPAKTAIPLVPARPDAATTTNA